MTPAKATIRRLGARQLVWQFHQPSPRARVLEHADELMDPFPCFSHDIDIVRAGLAHLGFVEPLVPLTVWISEFEPVSRVLAFTAQRLKYSQHEPPKLKANAILLAGKRTPIHPAVTRYLVAHEYGHALEDWIETARGLKSDALHEEYLALRAGVGRHHGDGQRWTDAIGEVMACDFRVAVANVETEFWPHPGIPLPDARIAQWWDEAISDVRRASGQEELFQQTAIA